MSDLLYLALLDPDGVLKGYKVELELGSDPSILCSVLPKVRKRGTSLTSCSAASGRL